MNKYFIEYYWSKLIKKIRGSAIINCNIHKTSKIESGCHIVNTNMEKYSFCGYDCEVINCSIGSFCSIANNVIIGGAMHPIEWVSTSPVFYKGRDSVKKKFSEFDLPESKKTIIEHDVWIGNNVLIKQGIKVGTGSIIGMGSVVTKDIPPYEIWGGNPARLIRKRFNDDIVSVLLKNKWWDKNESDLLKNAKYFNNIDLFVNKGLK